MKKWREGFWHIDYSLRSIAYFPPGEYEEFTALPEPKIRIDSVQELNTLIDFLFKNGYIKPQLGENRTEDIKIIHRLIDLAEKR